MGRSSPPVDFSMMIIPLCAVLSAIRIVVQFFYVEYDDLPAVQTDRPDRLQAGKRPVDALTRRADLLGHLLLRYLYADANPARRLLLAMRFCQFQEGLRHAAQH